MIVYNIYVLKRMIALKRFFALGLAAALLISFCGCNSGEQTGGTSTASSVQSTPIYADGNGTVEAPESVEIATAGAVTVSGAVKAEGNDYYIVLESVTTFIIKGSNGDTTYPDFTRVKINNDEVNKLAELKGLTVVISGDLKSDGGAMLILSEIAIENVME